MMTNAVKTGTLGLVLVLFLFSSCASSAGAGPVVAAPAAKGGKAPAWYINLDSQYPDKDFMAAVGSGSSRRSAEEIARGELAKRFSVKVTMTSQAEQRYRDVVKGSESYSESERSIMERVDSSAEQTLVDIKFSEPYDDGKGTVHIAAFLNRNEATGQYKNMIDRDLKTVESMVSRSEAAPTKIRSLAMVDTALQVSNHADVLIAQLDLINRAAGKLYGGKTTTQDLLKRRDALASGISVALAIEGDTEGKISAIAGKVLEDLKFTTSPSAPMVLIGSIKMDPGAARRADRKGVRWTLTLSLIDEAGSSLTTIFKEQLEEGISDKEVQAFAIKQIEKLVQKDLAKSITTYMTNVAVGK